MLAMLVAAVMSYPFYSDIQSTGKEVEIVVDLSDQTLSVYEDDKVIGWTDVSTGTPERYTPTGTFTILQKRVEHYSSTYDNAPMPYMQRLTWKGIALHAGHLPGYPASHGCIRMPLAFAKQLYKITKLDTKVTIQQ